MHQAQQQCKKGTKKTRMELLSAKLQEDQEI